MTKTRIALSALLLSGIAGCSTPGQTPVVNPPVVNPAQIQQDIIVACTASGLFLPVVQAGIQILVPAGQLPWALIQAGIDKVCANPAAFAAQAGIVEWLIQQLAPITASRRAMLSR